MKNIKVSVLLLCTLFSILCCSKPDDGGDSPTPKPTPDPTPVDPTPVQIDYVNVPDANFKNFLLEKYDIDKDGGISDDEARKVTSMDCSSKGIYSLSGIRCFTELTSLNCSGNNLTELVLTGSSTKADVPEGDCSKLTTINCSNNKITELIVDGCTSLSTLDCSNNKLSNLDVSNNGSLSTLDCSGNTNLSKVTTFEGQTIDNVKKDDGTVIGPVSVPVESVSISSSSLELTEGERATLTATITPLNASNKNVNWSSSDANVATVDANGKVTAVKAGTATITAKTEDGGKTASCNVTVKSKGDEPAATKAVESVSIDKTSIELVEDSSVTLIATVNPSDATNRNVSWSSNSPDVAVVDAGGKVSAVREGSAVITVTTEDGGKTANCTVTVLKRTGTEDVPDNGEVHNWN